MLNRTRDVMLKMFFLLLVAAIASACGMNSRSSIVAGYDNISGTYYFTGLGNYSADQFPNPLIDFSGVSTPSDVNIEQTDNVIRAAYITNAGESVIKTVNLSDNSNVIWRDSMLTTTEKVPVVGPAILPLPAKHYRGTRILRGEDGNLYIIGFFKEKGFLFTDYSEHELMLKRID